LIRRRAIPSALALLLSALPASASTPAAYDLAFVLRFEQACVPQRLSFEGTKAQALSEGWKAVSETDNAELGSMMAVAKKAAIDPEYPDWKTDFAVFRHTILDAPAYLVVTHLAAPDVINLVGCHLFDFDRQEMIDPALVTALIGNPIGESVDDQGLLSHVWGPPPALPRTLDTYLTLVKDESPLVAMTGFSGLTMKFETSEPEVQ